MPNILDVTIDPDIVLDESKIKGMPDDIKQNLLITMTIAAERYNCNWRQLTWSVKFNQERMPVISVKKRPEKVVKLTIKDRFLRLFRKK